MTRMGASKIFYAPIRVIRGKVPYQKLTFKPNWIPFDVEYADSHHGPPL